MRTFVWIATVSVIVFAIFVAWLEFMSYVDASLRENVPQVCQITDPVDGKVVVRTCSGSEIRKLAKQAKTPKNSVASARAVGATGRVKP